MIVVADSSPLNYLILLEQTALLHRLYGSEVDGRIEAARRSFRVTGTLGVLRAAAGEGLIDVRSVLDRLASTNFYADEQLLSKLFEKWLKE